MTSLVWIFTFFYFLTNTYISWNLNYESFDGYLYLSQAKRLLNFSEFPYPLESSRPRFLVAVLYLFYEIKNLVLPRVSEIRSVHIFMIGLNALAFPIWLSTFSKILKKEIALYLVLALGVFYQVWEFSYYAVADLLCLSLWGIFFWIHFSLDSRKTIKWIVYGIVGAFIALTKYPHFFFLPLFLVIEIVLRGKKVLPSLWIALFNFILTLEIFQRLFGDHSEGFWFNVRVYLEYLYILPGFSHHAPTYLPPTSFFTYVIDIFRGFGPLVFVLGVLCFLVFLLEKGKALRDLGDKEKSFFLVSLAMGLWHHVISHKEARYFLPFIPALLAFALLVFFKSDQLKTLRHSLNGWKKTALLLVLFAFPLVRSAKAAWINFQAPPLKDQKEMERILSWIREAPCQSYYVCVRRVLGHKLDHVFLGFHFPHKVFYESYCTGEELGNPTLISKKLTQKTQDEPGPGICMLYGKSFFNPPEFPPFELYRWEKTGETAGFVRAK